MLSQELFWGGKKSEDNNVPSGLYVQFQLIFKLANEYYLDRELRGKLGHILQMR